MEETPQGLDVFGMRSTVQINRVQAEGEGEAVGEAVDEDEDVDAVGEVA